MWAWGGPLVSEMEAFPRPAGSPISDCSFQESLLPHLSLLSEVSISLLLHSPRAWSRGLGPHPDSAAGRLDRLLSTPAAL